MGDNFKFQLSWTNTSITGILSTATIDVSTETAVLESRTAQYSTYSIAFEIDLDAPAGLEPARPNLTVRDNLSGRLRRVDATDPDVTAEVIVLDWVTQWTVDKIFGLCNGE